MKAKGAVSLLFVLLLSCLSACTTVQPWERGVLAKPQMGLEANPMQSRMRTHVYSSREAAGDVNFSGGGGGCGCY
ncbi:MAG: DUF4266 domain-containing protein [Pseudomonadales bacterium]|nr:DUF4266 domain-containing protein [Pseudomonadales bacterium]MCP5359095.1 DUF4266 domain-containing protein [Pseudomonadales bacterium]